MTNRDKILIEHIFNEILKIEKSTHRLVISKFKSNPDIQDAALRRIEIIGEAPKGLSADLKSKYTSVEWKKVSGTRDILIHAYFQC